ncbi:MAG: hypothetical protein NTW21_28995 [Verrucomicrobia bacterium]|nr:hypothetical protein [Verrucomicrobiota bacterium]
MNNHKPRGRAKERATMLALWSMVWVSTEAAPTGGQPSRLSGKTGVPPVVSMTDTPDAPVCQVIPFNRDFRFGLGTRKDAELACTVPIATNTRARFLRIVYTGVSDGFWPSHREVEISGTRRNP